MKERHTRAWCKQALITILCVLEVNTWLSTSKLLQFQRACEHPLFDWTTHGILERGFVICLWFMSGKTIIDNRALLVPGFVMPFVKMPARNCFVAVLDDDAAAVLHDVLQPYRSYPMCPWPRIDASRLFNTVLVVASPSSQVVSCLSVQPAVC